MRILMTNICLTDRSGTELVTVEVALRLHAAGDRVAVYTPLKGKTATLLQPHGIVVTDRIRDLGGFLPDLLHGHHNTPFLVARGAFPDVPAVWSCHDYRSLWDRPPPAHTAQLFLAHSVETAERLRVEGGVAEERIRILPNAADVAAFKAPAAAGSPRSVLFVGKGEGGGPMSAAAEAMRARGWQVTGVGPGLGPTVSNLPKLMAAHAVVVSSGRVAFEALAAGCAVVCADGRGLAGLVTPETFHALRRRNFGGSALTRRLDPLAVAAEVEAVDPEAQDTLRRMAMPEIGLDLYLERLRAIHAEAIALSGSPAPGDALRGGEMLEAMLATPRPGGFGPEELKRREAAFAARLSALEREAARLRLRLRLATLKPGGRLLIKEWQGGPGPALLGPGWAALPEKRVGFAGKAVVDLAEASAQRPISRAVLRLLPVASPGKGSVEAMDGTQVLVAATAEGGTATLELCGEVLGPAGAKRFELRAHGHWALAEMELILP